MPSKLYLHGDPEPLWCQDNADQLINHLAEATIPASDRFIRIDMAPYATDDHSRPAYVRPSAVAAVLPVHPKEWEHALDNLPDWLDG